MTPFDRVSSGAASKLWKIFMLLWSPFKLFCNNIMGLLAPSDTCWMLLIVSFLASSANKYLTLIHFLSGNTQGFKYLLFVLSRWNPIYVLKVAKQNRMTSQQVLVTVIKLPTIYRLVSFFAPFLHCFMTSFLLFLLPSRGCFVGSFDFRFEGHQYTAFFLILLYEYYVWFCWLTFPYLCSCFLPSVFC